MAAVETFREPAELAAEAEAWKNGFYNMCEKQLFFLQQKFGDFHPRMGVVLGSGLGGMAHHEEFEEVGHLAFENIPGMTKPGTPSHEGVMYWGQIRNLPVMLWAGRVQTTDYLGWETTPARAAKLATAHLVVAKGLGVDTMVITSAAGILHNVDDDEAVLQGVHIPYKGDVIAIADYTNFTPLAGPMLAPFDERLGQRFNGRGHLLDMKLYGYIQDALGQRCFIGSYNQSPSMPFFESRKDLIRINPFAGLVPGVPRSIDVAGMSMAAEFDVLLSHNPNSFDVHGFDKKPRIFGFSLGTNDIKPAYLSLHEQVAEALAEANAATHEEVSDAGKDAEPYLIPAFAQMCEQVAQEA